MAAPHPLADSAEESVPPPFVELVEGAAPLPLEESSTAAPSPPLVESAEGSVPPPLVEPPEAASPLPLAESAEAAILLPFAPPELQSPAEEEEEVAALLSVAAAEPAEPAVEEEEVAALLSVAAAEPAEPAVEEEEVAALLSVAAAEPAEPEDAVAAPSSVAGGLSHEEADSASSDADGSIKEDLDPSEPIGTPIDLMGWLALGEEHLMLAEPATLASAEPLTGGEQASPLEAITSQPSAAAPVGELSSSFDNNAALTHKSVADSGMAAVLDMPLLDDGIIEEAVQQLVTQSPAAAIATEPALLASQAEGESTSPSQPVAAVSCCAAESVSDVPHMLGTEPVIDSVLSAAVTEAADAEQATSSHLIISAETDIISSSPNLVADQQDAVGLQSTEEHRRQGSAIMEVIGSEAPEQQEGEGGALVRCWSEKREEAEVAEAAAYAVSLLAEADAAAAAGAALIAIKLRAEKAAIAVAATETVARLRSEKELAAMAAAEERRLHAEKVMAEAAAAAQLQLEEAAAAEAAAMERKAEEETAAALAAATARRQAEEEAATLAAADAPVGHHSSGYTPAHQPAHGDGYEAYALDLPMPDYGIFTGTTPLRVARSPTWQSSPVSGSAQITARTPSGDTVHLPAMVHWGASPVDGGGDSAFSPEAAAAAVGWVPLSGTAQVTALTASGSMVVLPAFVVVDARAVSRAVSASPPSGQRSSRTPGGSPGGYFGPYGLQGQVSPTSSQRQRGQYTPHSISPGGASGFRNNSPRKAGLTSHPILDADEWIEE